MTYDEYKALLASNPNVRKMLDVISIMEGTSTFSNPYLAQGGTNGKLLATGYDNHPAAYGHGKWAYKKLSGGTGPSTANGKYAFIYPTWQGLQKQFGGKLKFNPEGQDIAALELIRQRGQLQNLVNGNYKPLIQSIGHTWASLPTAPLAYDQARGSWDKLARAFKTVGLDPNAIGMKGQYQALNGYNPNAGATGANTLNQMAGVQQANEGQAVVTPWQHQQSAMRQAQQEADYFTQRLQGGLASPRREDYDPLAGLSQAFNSFNQASKRWQQGLKRPAQNNDLFGF